jgi:hypothetical protein
MIRKWETYKTKGFRLSTPRVLRTRGNARKVESLDETRNSSYILQWKCLLENLAVGKERREDSIKLGVCVVQLRACGMSNWIFHCRGFCDCLSVLPRLLKCLARRAVRPTEVFRILLTLPNKYCDHPLLSTSQFTLGTTQFIITFVSTS